MHDVRVRLDQDLKAAVSRLRQLGGATAIEERTGASEDTYAFADEIDGIQAGESREIGFATRELLLERVNRLSAALERISEGDYGACGACGGPISAARLNAMPEAQTCLRCQDGLERLGRHVYRSRHSAFAVGKNGAIGAELGFGSLVAPVRRRKRRYESMRPLSPERAGR
jgi:RNA polymerase-binding transcription factor DksA